MVLSMACFAIEDALLKLAALTLPAGQILLSFGLVGLVVFSIMALLAGESPVPKAAWSRVIALRSTFEIIGRLFFMLAIALTPLSTASAILQSTPLVVIAGAALIFKETIGVRRWLAVAVGLAGMLLILRPGTDGFSSLSVLAVIATLGFAARDLATRAAPMAMSHYQLGVLGFTSLIIAGTLAMPFGAAPSVPDLRTASCLLAASVAGVVAYGSLTTAMRTGEIGAVTPFRYTRLAFAMMAGFIIFGERPDIWMVLGSAVVVGAGIMALTISPKKRLAIANVARPD